MLHKCRVMTSSCARIVINHWPAAVGVTVFTTARTNQMKKIVVGILYLHLSSFWSLTPHNIYMNVGR